MVLQANEGSGHASISADGRYVAFISYASNLVPGDTNGISDVFVRDLQTGALTRVSTGENDQERWKLIRAFRLTGAM